MTSTYYITALVIKLTEELEVYKKPTDIPELEGLVEDIILVSALRKLNQTIIKLAKATLSSEDKS